MKIALALIAALAGVGILVFVRPQTGEANVKPASTIGQPSGSGREEAAVFAAGCFWGVEDAFRRVEGVLSTTVGYTGGHFENPTYEDVCAHKTGHAEAVQVVYDPGKVSYDRLLEVFWSCHNPTQVNRQGPDFGSQYRSAIFCLTDAQQSAAEASRDRLAGSGRYSGPIATQIVPGGTFWKAEEYHQQYHQKHGGACAY